MEQSENLLDNARAIDIKEFTDKNIRINWTPTTDIVEIKGNQLLWCH